MNNKLIKILIAVCILLLTYSCAAGPKIKIVELENKGTIMNLATPNWVKLYVANGVAPLHKLPEFKNKYCVVGEETGVNRQFITAWADNASAQQRIGQMVRTNIASRYEASVTGNSELGANNASQYKQEIDNLLTAVVNVSYSGAQREADWWSLRRRYDPDEKDVFTDEYTAWVLYTIPREEMNRQIAFALETSVSKDSALYDITIALARDILQQGYDKGE